jgi:preprotein translocase subunit YajC
MTLETLKVTLAMAAPPQNGQQPDQKAQLIQMVSMMVLMGVVFYFILIRPQQKRTKQQQQLLGNLKPGDKIVTNSGIIGVVISVKEKSVSIRSADAKLEITKGAVTEITERGGETPAS